MLKIRFVILAGVLLGSALSFAAVKTRPRQESHGVKKAETQSETNRKVSSQN